MTARRDLLKALAMIPASVSMPSAGALEGLIAAAGAATAVGPVDVKDLTPNQKRLGLGVWQMLNRAYMEFQDNRRVRTAIRVNCLDPDIAAMRSWSLTTKVRAQIARDTQEVSLTLRAYMMLHGDM